jgi:two-component system, chemotaxis family, chemotaxis protein CheY
MGNNGRATEGFPEEPCEASVAIIEDNVEIARLYVMLIKSMGMQVSFVAGDGDAGVKAFRAAARPPDILLVDHRMPIKNGLEAMREILSLQPAARFVFVSADEDMKSAAIAAGAKVFLAKPACMRDIADALKKALSPAG